MNTDLNYIKGVVETCLDYYENLNGRIDPDKDLQLFYEPITASKGEQIIGAKVTFTWKTWASNKWDKDSLLDDEYINVFNGEKLSSFISDVDSILSDIHKKSIGY